MNWMGFYFVILLIFAAVIVYIVIMAMATELVYGVHDPLQPNGLLFNYDALINSTTIHHSTEAQLTTPFRLSMSLHRKQYHEPPTSRMTNFLAFCPTTKQSSLSRFGHDCTKNHMGKIS